MSEVSGLFDRYDADELSRSELLERLAGLTYRQIKPSGMDDGGVPDFPQEGTLEDLQFAAITSRMSEDEMERVVTEVLVLEAGTRLLAEVLTDDGQLRTGGFRSRRCRGRGPLIEDERMSRIRYTWG